MLMLKIAIRNIYRQKRRTLLTALSMFGGFLLAAFFIGLSDGMYNNIIDVFTRNQMGHIQLHQGDYLDRPSLYKTMTNLEELEARPKEVPEVESWAPRLYSAGLASVREKTAGVKIIGIDLEKENRTTKFQDKVTVGKAFSKNPFGEVLLGKGLAKLLKTRVGEDVVILSQAADGSIANDKYKITGLVDNGDEIGDRMAFYLPMATAQELLVLENRIHEMAVTVRTLDDVDPVKEQLKLKLHGPEASAETGITVDTWKEFAKSFYMAMKADKEGMWVMLVVVVLVVAVGVLNTVLMSVMERQKEYGVLKAVGTRPGQIIKMVLLEVNILSVICVAAGIVVGLGLNYFASVNGFTLAEPISYGGISFDKMMTEVNARSFYIPAITVICVATLVSLLPALKAAHTDPASSMRTH